MYLPVTILVGIRMTNLTNIDNRRFKLSNQRFFHLNGSAEQKVSTVVPREAVRTADKICSIFSFTSPGMNSTSLPGCARATLSSSADISTGSCSQNISCSDSGTTPNANSGGLLSICGPDNCMDLIVDRPVPANKSISINSPHKPHRTSEQSR
jgi:hypothetical protein